MPEPVVARHLLITGRVQGVSYRATACAEAERLGLAGWVRNRRDGSVEAVVSGPAEVVERFIEWARRGPPAARVDGVAVTAAAPSADAGFDMRPTA